MQFGNEIKPILENKLLVAHNAAFDIDVLEKTLIQYDLSINYNSTCTLELARKTYPGLPSYSLDKLANHFGIELEHHNCKSDALACAKIMIMCNGVSADFNPITENKKNPRKTLKLKNVYHDKIRSEFLKPDFKNANPTNFFYKKKVVITGEFDCYDRNELAEILFKRGADIDLNVGKKIDYLIAGKDPGENKILKINELNQNGSNAKVIYEKELIDILGIHNELI